MKLVHSPASPFVRKVRVTILECGLQDRVEMQQVATSATAPAAEAIAANPLGKIPALLREDGPAIHDSRVITRYLNAVAGADLYPQARQWEVLTLESLADGIMEAGVLMVYEYRLRPDDKVFPEWVEAQWNRITRTLDVIGDRWISHLNGPLDASQIALACALGYLDFRHGDRNWRADRPALAQWAEGFGQRPAMQDTVPA
ncbi:glutathione S-transferase [Pseudooceanicola aestuarii]|uniref:glutathione S-transferase n=1 Tax=Pseudooceanicola aestuarii TaxID=2697319 RepID=UPI0013D7AB6E|nr:glutathione S-transferase [Pseudooceanicola aestuarii]